MSDSLLSQAEIDALLSQRVKFPVESSPDAALLDEAPKGAAGKETSVQEIRGNGDNPKLGLILDVPLKITVSLSNMEKALGDVLELSPGAILEFPRPVSEPVDILVNGKPVARGEVVVVDETYAVRITRIISPEDRVRKML